MKKSSGLILGLSTATIGLTAYLGHLLWTTEFPIDAHNNLNLETRLSAERDPELTDFIGKKLNFFDKDYEIYWGRLNSAEDSIGFMLMTGQQSDTLKLGETKSYNVNGKTLEIKLKEMRKVGPNNCCTLEINGKDRWVGVLGIYDDHDLGVAHVGEDSCKFYLGNPERLILVDIFTDDKYTKLKYDSRFAVRFDGSRATGSFKLDTIRLYRMKE